MFTLWTFIVALATGKTRVAKKAAMITSWNNFIFLTTDIPLSTTIHTIKGVGSAPYQPERWNNSTTFILNPI
jgi:hypothetical protein